VLFLQECLRACQESIEQVITTNLQSLIQQSQQDPRIPPLKISQPFVIQSTTPTDVHNINFLAIDDENSLHMLAEHDSV
jgi:hypothetical protein